MKYYIGIDLGGTNIVAGVVDDVAGGNVGLGADVAGKLGHKALAEPHDLGVGFALGVKVAAPLAESLISANDRMMKKNKVK